MTAAHAKQQISAGKDFFQCAKYKTSKKYGLLGKWISMGTKVAIMTYLNLPGKTSELLLDAPYKHKMSG